MPCFDNLPCLRKSLMQAWHDENGLPHTLILPFGIVRWILLLLSNVLDFGTSGNIIISLFRLRLKDFLHIRSVYPSTLRPAPCTLHEEEYLGGFNHILYSLFERSQLINCRISLFSYFSLFGISSHSLL